MSDYITLLGAEQVQQAAHTMRHAAEEMNRAASSYQDAVQQQQRNNEDFLLRFEALIERLENTGASKP